MEEKYEKVSLKAKRPYDEGGAFYGDVKGLEFIPEEKVTEIMPTYKKGEWFFLKLLGLVPLIPCKAWKDLYFYNPAPFCRLRAEDISEYFSNEYDTSSYKLVGNTVYKRAVVIGDCHNSERSRMRYFDSNKEAMEYFDYTKKKCKDYDNELDNGV